MTGYHPTSSTDLARHAVKLAAKLTPAQRHALQTGQPAHVRVYKNLRAAELVEHQGGPALHRDTVRTNFGRIVAMVLAKGAETVLATGGREDAALFIATSREIVISEGAAMAAGTDDTATVAFRAALLDHLHGLAIVEYARHQAAELFATGASEDTVGNALDVIRPAEATPHTAAFRQAVMDELHGRALAEYARLEECRAALRQVGAELDGARIDLPPAVLVPVAEDNPHATHTGARNACPDDRCRAYLKPSTGVEVYPTTTEPAGPRWVIPTEGTRMSNRHDLLGPYNTDDLAEWIRDRYRAEGIACEIVRSPTRPVLKADAHTQD